MPEEPVRYEERDAIAIITLNRPEKLNTLTDAMVNGVADGIDEGLPASVKDATLPKFRPGGILIVHAGGRAGLFSAIIGGWVNGEVGSQPVIQEIRP